MSGERPDTNGAERHRTAIRRDELSRPFKVLAAHGYLSGGYTVFDYGCGRGDDVRLLQAHGVDAHGWDPYYQPDDPKHDADVVNLGYVVNVIESETERADVVTDAWSLARTCLVISVMLKGRGGGNTTGGMSERVSQWNTYQRYFSQAEFRDWIGEVLGEPAIPVAPGVVVVHRDKLAEQRFLLERNRRRVGEVLFSLRAAQATREQTQAFYETHRETLEPLWAEAVRRGRTPLPQEVPSDVAETANKLFRSIERAIDWLTAYFGPDDLAAGASRRREDLLVTFALDVFSGWRRYREWPPELQQDVRALWKSYKTAVEQANALLYSVGDPETIARSCEYAAAQGLGHLDASKSFQTHSRQISALPPALRTYVGCAEQLYGDVGHADLVKIHIHSGKMTLLFYDDFDKRVPMLLHRVKILLRQQDIEFFDYGEEYPAQPLWMKSLYMTSDMPDYDEQRWFDITLAELPELDFSGFGPSWKEFEAAIDKLGFQFDGRQLVKPS